MARRKSKSERKNPDEDLRVVYLRDDKLHPRDTEGKVVDAMPRTPREGYTFKEAVEYAAWILRNTVWTDGVAYVQQRDFDGRYKTVHTEEIF